MVREQSVSEYRPECERECGGEKQEVWEGSGSSECDKEAKETSA